MIKASVAVNSPVRSQSMERIATALERFAPRSVQIVDAAQADVVLLHTIGYPETVEHLDRLDRLGKRAVIAQYCLRTTQQPSVKEWLPLWSRAALVWSYYDLVALAKEDGCDFSDPAKCWPTFGFYYSPLGSDPYVFTPPRSENRIFTVLTSGYVAETEGVNECSEAVKRIGGRMFHLGPPNVVTGPHVTWGVGIDDDLLAVRYGQSKFVAGLRRVEGFEMPAVEGLLCGARPVMFDRPHYRAWFEEFAEFVPEDADNVVTRELATLFRSGARAVTPQERVEAVKAFAWNRIASEFWSQVERAI